MCAAGPGQAAPFQLPRATTIVPDEDEDLVQGVDNHPASAMRPQNQFLSLATSVDDPPTFVVGTVVVNPSPALQLSYDSLRQSSLTSWKWFIVDHGSSDRASLELLESLFAGDARVELIRAGRNTNPADVMNDLLQSFSTSQATCAVFLDAGAMVEHTILEKMAWSLASVATWDLVGHFTAVYGANQSIIATGLHSGGENLHRKLVPTSTAFRVSALAQVNCQFDSGQAVEALVWDFFLCWAAQGRWGGVSNKC